MTPVFIKGETEAHIADLLNAALRPSAVYRLLLRAHTLLICVRSSCTARARVNSNTYPLGTPRRSTSAGVRLYLAVLGKPLVSNKLLA